ncbi:ROK family protein [Nocardia sp. NRRL S-836]|uniref:ROK family protein n=1 Tax=Nocardia sp. NRRL S-836 TaxID=1519492 RepID=UPI0006AE4221|nr:ROK family protein [Nocardia sp. NRRL S-836]
MTTVVDVGGTHLRWASWSAGGGLRDRRSRPAPSFRSHPSLPVTELRRLLVETICAEVPHGAVAGVSFGAAMNQHNATVYASAPLWGAHDEPFDLLGALRSVRSDVDWHVVNDVTAALLHVASTRFATDRKVLLATISTGIACRTLDRGRIPLDASGLQGEIGHLPAVAHLAGAPVVLHCDCGEPGHLAAYSSGRGIARMADVLRQRRPQEWAASALADTGAAFERVFTAAVEAGDALAAELLAAVTAPVADVLRTALCLDPDLDRIVLTGGVATSFGGRYREALLAHLERTGLYLTSRYTPEWVADRIVVVGPGEADCLVGAGIAASAAAGAGASAGAVLGTRAVAVGTAGAGASAGAATAAGAATVLSTGTASVSTGAGAAAGAAAGVGTAAGVVTAGAGAVEAAVGAGAAGGGAG